MVHADSCSGAASFHLHKHIYSSKANTMAGNLFILRFLVLPHLHRERGSWNLLRVRVLLERSWKWCGRDFHAFLDAVNREITTEVPLSRAPNPQLLPGRRSINGCHLLVCVHGVCVFTAVCVHFGWVECRAQIPSMGHQGSRVRPNFSMVRLKKIWGRTGATSRSREKKVSATLKVSLWFNNRHTLGPYHDLNQS